MSTIGSIHSGATTHSISNLRSSGGLTADQKSSIKSVLSQFDSKKITASDAKKITSEFTKLGIKPGRELEEAMAAAGFDAKQVGNLAFGQGQQPRGGGSGGYSQAIVSNSVSELKSLMASMGTGTRDSAQSDQEIAQATDTFLQTIFAQSADARTSNTRQRIPQEQPPLGGPQGGNPPPPPPSGVHDGYQSASDIETYLTSLIDSLSSGAPSADSNVSQAQGTSQFFDSVNSLLKATGVDASTENLQSFMQILQKNISVSIEDKGNLVDHLA